MNFRHTRGNFLGCMFHALLWISAWHAKSLQSCLTFYDPMNCSPPGSSVCGILQAKILEWVECPPPGNLPNLGTEPASLMSCVLASRFFTTNATREVLAVCMLNLMEEYVKVSWKWQYRILRSRSSVSMLKYPLVARSIWSKLIICSRTHLPGSS